MYIDRKFMEKKNWKRVIQRDYVYIPIEKEKIKGKVSLLHIKKVNEPCYMNYGKDKKIRIADDDFYWLQLGIEDANYWITVMYDNNQKLIQYYIDITEKNILNNEEELGFYDLILDIVLLKSGEIFLLDEEELNQARREKKITQEQYNLADRVAKHIIKELPKRKDELESISNKYLKILLKELNSKQ